MSGRRLMQAKPAGIDRRMGTTPARGGRVWLTAGPTHRIHDARTSNRTARAHSSATAPALPRRVRDSRWLR